MTRSGNGEVRTSQQPLQVKAYRAIDRNGNAKDGVWQFNWGDSLYTVSQDEATIDTIDF